MTPIIERRYSTVIEREKNKIVGGMLYLVATPIGNLSDISERAVKTLSEVDFIAAEDTRNTAKLLMNLGISKTLISYHDHNRREAGERIADRLASGESCALVTDAGSARPAMPTPIRLETPVPKMVSAKPVTTWFPRRVTVINA